MKFLTMKKIILFLMFSCFLTAQKIQYIELKNNIKDKNHIAKSFTLLDKRKDKTIGIVSHRKDPYEVKFEKDDLEKLFTEWFAENNKETGKTDYYLILEELAVKDIPAERSQMGHLQMKMVTFLKRNDKYYFLKKFNISKDYMQRDHAYITRAIAARISAELSNIINDSYDVKALNYPIAENELEDYEKNIKEKMPIYKADSLTNGVYMDFRSFVDQKKDLELIVRKNNEGKIKGVKRIDGYDNFKDYFAVIDNGIAYKKTPTCLIEIEKDEEGYFITAAAEELFPEQTNYYVAGAGGGLITALAVSVIDLAISRIRKQNAKYYRVGIDMLTGEYILPANFDKNK